MTRAAQPVVVVGDAVGVHGVEDRDLLRSHADDRHRALGEEALGRDREREPAGLDEHVVAGRPRPRALDQVGLAEEVGDEDGARQLVDVGRMAELLDAAGVHHRDGVGHRHGLLLVVRDVHERRAHLGLDALELDLHLPAQLEVERAERLVEQQDTGPVDERPGHGDALLLATGQLRGLAAGHRPELDEVEHVLDGLLDVLDLAAPEAEGDVLEDVEVREQRVRLEDRVDGALEGAQPGDVLLAEADRPLGRVLEPGDHAQGRRLAAA